jgi:magnesium chelatase family protein
MKKFQQESGIIKEIQDNPYLIEIAIDRFGLSARDYTRMLKVARTIADSQRSGKYPAAHLSGAIQYRSLDRNLVS